MVACARAARSTEEWDACTTRRSSKPVLKRRGTFSKRNIPGPQYTAWFSTLKLIAVTQEAVILEAENTVAAECLRGRYLGIISNVLGAQLGRAYDIEIYTHEQLLSQYKDMEKSMLNPALHV